MTNLKLDEVKNLQEQIEILQSKIYSIKKSVLSELYEKAKPFLEKEGISVKCESINLGYGYRDYDVCLFSDNDCSGYYKMRSDTQLIHNEGDCICELDSLIPSLNDSEKNIVKEFLKIFFIFSMDNYFGEYTLPVEIRYLEY